MLKHKLKRDFYELFDNREVIPYVFIDDYIEKIKIKNFEAAGYVINISQRIYFALKKQGLIDNREKTWILYIATTTKN